MRIKLLETEEIPELYKILMEPGIASNLCADPTVITEGNLAGFLLSTDTDTVARAYAIYDGEALVGAVTLNNISMIKNSAYIGIVAVKSGTKGNVGLGAANWAISYCFNTLNLNRVYSHTWSDNERMEAIYKRVGAVNEGTEREHTWKQGQYVDMKIWSILRREYNG